ncbi:MAG: hypothetical protein M3331_02735 [Actinomycetota bacterium]|nr:hypothetical protein [Actinomycetota bacterium]
MAAPPLDSSPPPRPLSEDETGFNRLGMVSWLSPKLLVAAGLEVFASGVFSRFLDKRELQAGQPGYGDDLEPGEGEPPAEPFTHPSYRDEGGNLWLDYAADVGEGFDPTYTVAWLLACKSLDLDLDGDLLATRRGRILVLGGDQVYPGASWEGYRDRFVGPYRAALPHLPSDEVPHLFAIPGNHDWYDGLTSFTRLFAQRSWIGAWRTRQRRSYFALRLSEKWWLWATDVQFDAYIDGPQLEYFRKAAAELEEGHLVILATAKPSWVGAKPATHSAVKREGSWETLSFVEEKLIGESRGELAVTVSGDRHHYARYAKVSGDGPSHRITAGGGGAHSMGTSGLPGLLKLPSLERPERSARYELGASSPTAEESEAMREEGLRSAVLRVKGLGAMIGGLYALISLAFADAVKDGSGGLVEPGEFSFPEILVDAGSAWSYGLIGLLLVALYRFADVKDPATKRRAAFIHWLAHLMLALVAPGVLIIVLDETGVAEEGLLVGWIAALAAGILGFWGGRLIFGEYLLRVNRSGPRRHGGEVWGALASTDYKNFLRMKIDSDERLTIFPVGIRRSVRWRFEPNGGTDDPWFVPADEAPDPRLLEAPVVIEPND